MYQSTVAARDEGDASLEDERLDEVLLAEVEVDRALVHGRVRAVALDEAEERARLAVDDRERLGVARAERDARRRVVAALPDVARRRALELRQLGRAAKRLGAERGRVVLVERRLERGREHVGVEDARVRVVEDRGLDAAREQRVGLAREELVERVVARRREPPGPRPRRPARPHCWRSDATVPGKPTEIAQSSSPMSIPSSSASVAVTPSSSPSTSRRSISRRCSAV